MDGRSLRHVLVLSLVACGSSAGDASVVLPDGAPNVGFDDLRYSPALHRVLVPAGRSGRLDLVDPDTLALTSVAGFSASGARSDGHDDGATSVDEAHGRLYVTDRTATSITVVDPRSATRGASVPLGAHPDYVRFVAATNELWVTEPGAQRIEIFALGDDGAPRPSATIAVENGPESLVVDELRGRAYTHRWQASTVAIDVRARTIVAEWPNGCAASRGIALDETRGWLFSGCSEGTVAVLDVAHDGRIVASDARGAGFDVIGYSPTLRHLYLAGSACGCLVTYGVGDGGALAFLGRRDAPSSTHCVVADDRAHAWVCDPDQGRILRFDDSFPASP